MLIFFLPDIQHYNIQVQMRKLVLFITLMVAVTANNRIEVTCDVCANGLCNTYNGGPFSNYVVETQGSSCADGFPIVHEFVCRSGCLECQITTISAGQSQTMCSQSTVAKVAVQSLDVIYTQQQGKAGANYNWCNCGSSSNSGYQNGSNNGGATTISTTSTQDAIYNQGSNITITCNQRGNILYETYNGGPFSNREFRTFRTSCGDRYPMNINFACGTLCSSGCQVNIDIKGAQAENTTHCNTSYMGKLTTHFLNGKFSLQEGNPKLNSVYRWCNCPTRGNSGQSAGGSSLQGGNTQGSGSQGSNNYGNNGGASNQGSNDPNYGPQGSNTQGPNAQINGTQGSNSQGGTSGGSSSSQGSNTQGSNSQNQNTQGSTSQSLNTQNTQANNQGSNSQGSNTQNSNTQSTTNQGSNTQESNSQSSNSQDSSTQGSQVTPVVIVTPTPSTSNQTIPIIIAFNCSQCQHNSCIIVTANGGPFVNQNELLNNTNTCPAEYDASYEFVCAGLCQGCGIIVQYRNGTTKSVCSQSPDGQVIVKRANEVYLKIINGTAPDWCNCAGNNQNIETISENSSSGAQGSSSSGSGAQGSSGTSNSQGGSSTGIQIINSGANITVTCNVCGSQICETYNGGPFSNDIFPTTRQNCGTRYPISFQFSCDRTCLSQCSVTTRSAAPSSTIACAGAHNSLIGQITKDFLNKRYSQKIGDNTLNSTYQWCNCMN